MDPVTPVTPTPVVAPTLPTLPAATPVVSVKAAMPWKKMLMILGGGLVLVICLVVGGVFLMRSQGGNGGNTPAPAAVPPNAGGGTPTPVTPPAEVKHGWLATYSVFSTTDSKPKTLLITDTTLATPEPLTFAGMTGFVTVKQILDKDTLVIIDCPTYNSMGVCNAYKYVLSTTAATEIVSDIENLMDVKVLANGNVAYLHDYNNLTLSIIKSGTTTQLDKAGETIGRGGSLSDFRGISISPDRTHFVLNDTVGGYTDTYNYSFVVFNQEGTKLESLCDQNVGCRGFSPVMTDAAFIFSQGAGDTVNTKSFDFTTKATTTVAYDMRLDPSMSPDGQTIAYWTYDGNTAPGINLKFVKISDNSVITVDKPYSEPVWLDNDLLAVKVNAASEGMINFIYDTFIVTNRAGVAQNTLENGTASYVGNMEVLRY